MGKTLSAKYSDGNTCFVVPIDSLGQNDRAFSERIEDVDGFDPLKILFLAIHYRLLIGFFLLAGILAGTAYTGMTLPLYKAAAQVEIPIFRSRLVDRRYDELNDYADYYNATARIRSPEVAGRVVKALNLANKNDFLASRPKLSFRNIAPYFAGNPSPVSNEHWTPEQRESLAVNKVLNGISVETIDRSSVIRMSFTHPAREFVAPVADEIARSYLDVMAEQARQRSEETHAFLQDRVTETKASLEATEKSLLDYSKANGLTVTADGGSVITENMAHLTSVLAQAIQQRLTIERDRQQILDGKAGSIPPVFESEVLEAKKEKIAALEALYNNNLPLLKPGYPEMLRIRTEIEELQRQISDTTKAITDAVEVRYEQALAKEDNLRKELNLLEEEQRNYLDKNVQYTILKREADSFRAQYKRLVDELNENHVRRQWTSMQATMVSSALEPSSPFTPNLKKNLAGAVALFAMLAAAAIYLFQLLKNSFTVPDEIESELGLPVLGTVPATGADRIVAELANPKSQISEAYRSLRTSVQYTGTEHNVKTILVTSSEPGEGKSTSAYKLALEFAALGRKVLVIDADMRNPGLHRFFSAPQGLGLSNILSNVVQSGDVMKVFHKTEHENLTFLGSGNIPPNPADLLESSRMSSLLTNCSKFFDLIIIDSPPVLGLADTPILSRQVDITVFLVASEKTSRKSAKASLSRLEAVGGKVAGAVLTRVSLDRFDYAGGYQYMRYAYNEVGPERGALWPSRLKLSKT